MTLEVLPVFGQHITNRFLVKLLVTNQRSAFQKQQQPRGEGIFRIVVLFAEVLPQVEGRVRNQVFAIAREFGKLLLFAGFNELRLEPDLVEPPKSSLAFVPLAAFVHEDEQI